jgi:hypothetical protein
LYQQARIAPLLSRAKIHTAAREAAVAVFFLALALYATRPLGRDMRGQTLAGPDPLIDLWTVHWLASHALEPGALFEGNVFHPARRAVLFSDLSMGTAVFLAPLRVFVRDPVPLYNAGVLIALAFAGWAFSRLARELGAGIGGGLVAGVIAAFGSHQMCHVYHLNLLTTGWIALLLLALHRIATGGGWGSVALASASFALCVQSSGYYAVAAALLTGLMLLAHRHALLARPAALRMTAALGLAALLSMPYVVAFLRLRSDEGLRRPPGLSEKMAFRPDRDLTSHTYLYRHVIGDAPGTEHLFPGFLALALGGLALGRRRPHARACLLLIGALLLVSLGPRLEIGGLAVPLPYAALFAIPPLEAMRHPYTFAAVAVMLLGVLAALAVPRGRYAVPLVAIAVAEVLAPPLSVREVPPGVPPAYELLAKMPPGPILEIPVFSEGTLLWAARHGLPVANGDGAFAPTYHLTLQRYMKNHWLEREVPDIDASRPMPYLVQRIGPQYLVLPVGRFRGMDHLIEPLSRSKHFRLVATASDGDLVYERTQPAILF